jgi:hypothetical protein
MNARTAGAVSAALLCLAARAAAAATTAEIDEECPLDGTHFRATIDTSGYSSSRQLDLKQLGPIHDPSLLAECPTDHFVLYKQEFTPQEIASLRALVATPDYQAAAAAGDTTYYLLAKIYEHLGKGDQQVAFVYLRASWQAEATPARYGEYANQSLKHFTAWLSTSPTHDEDWATAELVSGELERRLGKLDAAKARFTALRGATELQDDTSAAIVKYELELIAAKDQAPHPAPKPGLKPQPK